MIQSRLRKELTADVEDINKLVRDYLLREYVEDIEDPEITDTTPLISGGIVDSFSMVSLKCFVEKKCNIRIPDADATPEAFDTIQGIADLVRRLRKG